MEIILEVIRITITIFLAVAVAWQVREIKNLHKDNFGLHTKIIELTNKNSDLEKKLKKVEQERDDNGYKIIAMQKAVADFKKSLRVK